MARLPRVSGKAMIAALKREGFTVIRVKGSHHFLRHTDGRATVVPVHGNETLGPGLLTSILRDCELERNALERLL